MWQEFTVKQQNGLIFFFLHMRKKLLGNFLKKHWWVTSVGMYRICHRGNNSALGIFQQGVKFRSSVLSVCACVCVCDFVRHPPHTGCGMKGVHSCIIRRLFHTFPLPVLYQSTFWQQNLQCFLSPTWLPWSQRSCGSCLLHFGDAIYPVREEYE